MSQPPKKIVPMGQGKSYASICRGLEEQAMIDRAKRKWDAKTARMRPEDRTAEFDPEVLLEIVRRQKKQDKITREKRKKKERGY